MSCKTLCVRGLVSCWQYWKVAVFFHFYDKVPKGSNLRKHLFWLLLWEYNLPIRRKGDGKNGSRTGSRSVKHFVTWPSQSGMNTATQLAFLFFSFKSESPSPQGLMPSMFTMIFSTCSTSLETSAQLHLYLSHIPISISHIYIILCPTKLKMNICQPMVESLRSSWPGLQVSGGVLLETLGLWFLYLLFHFLVLRWILLLCCTFPT